MTSRLRSLAGTAILTLPLATAAAVLPAATAQAGTLCGPDQATVYFADRPPACQSAGPQFFARPTVRAVCTGPSAIAAVLPGDGSKVVQPDSCADYPPGEVDIITVVPT